MLAGLRDARGRLSTRVAWGLLDQGFSSVTNFVLFVAAGRRLGPESLGVVSIGFTAYLILLVLQRALITDPLIVTPGGGEQSLPAAPSAVTASLLFGALATAALAVLGELIPGDVGRGMLLFAPWILIALLQDMWRFLLFKEHRGLHAVANDGVWVVVMTVALPVAWHLGTQAAIVGSWGLGAAAGGVLGFRQARVGLERVAAAWTWWLREAWPFGRWLGLGKLVELAGNQGAVFFLALILSPGDIGGLRAVQSIFSPLSVLAPAIALPGLPALVQRSAESPVRARGLAVRLGGAVTMLALAYVAVLATIGSPLLSFLFGRAFEPFRHLLPAVAAGQVWTAMGLGFVLLLKARKRSSTLLWAHAGGTVVAVALAWTLGVSSGVAGAAWGLAIGAGVDSLLLAILAWRT